MLTFLAILNNALTLVVGAAVVYMVLDLLFPAKR